MYAVYMQNYNREIWEVQEKYQNISVFLLDNITIVNK